jgi:hypothetical protein
MNNRVCFTLICLIGLFWLVPQANGLAQEGSPTPGLDAGTVTPTSTPDLPQITSPLGGQALQGSHPIEGSIPIAGFAGAELSFAYQADATQTWFLIAELIQIPDGPVLAQWDTTTITDGIYTLRLVVTNVDGSRSSAIVTGLRVRNYSPVETITPTAVTPSATPEPGDTPVPSATLVPTLTPVPSTSTPLPPNPAQIDQLDILLTMGKGALAILGFLCVLGLYQTIKGHLRDRGSQKPR